MSRMVDPLIDINLDDLLDALGLPALRGAVPRAMLRPAVQRFTGIVRAFDDRVGATGLAAASGWVLQRLAGGLQVAGESHIPSHGPLLVLSNHPGMTDTAALFASLHMRADLRVIARDRPFLRALPHTGASLILLADGDDSARVRALYAGLKHLRRGGALLTFPAGEIEPDPAAAGVRPALNGLQAWSDSYAVFARAVPAARIVTAIVSQVVSARALRHPLTRLRRDAADREKLAAAMQILWPPYQAMPARVAFAAPLAADAHSPAELRRAIGATARALIAMPVATWGD
jgi:hypothetical protein